MAQVVGYWSDDVVYEEGPFVMVWAISGWRLEVEMEGSRCPVLADVSIYEFAESHGKSPRKTENRKQMEDTVDFLNKKVQEGVLVKFNKCWVTQERRKELEVLCKS